MGKSFASNMSKVRLNKKTDVAIDVSGGSAVASAVCSEVCWMGIMTCQKMISQTQKEMNTKPKLWMHSWQSICTTMHVWFAFLQVLKVLTSGSQNSGLELNDVMF